MYLRNSGTIYYTEIIRVLLLQSDPPNNFILDLAGQQILIQTLQMGYKPERLISPLNKSSDFSLIPIFQIVCLVAPSRIYGANIVN